MTDSYNYDKMVKDASNIYFNKRLLENVDKVKQGSQNNLIKYTPRSIKSKIELIKSDRSQQVMKKKDNYINKLSFEKKSEEELREMHRKKFANLKLPERLTKSKNEGQFETMNRRNSSVGLESNRESRLSKSMDVGKYIVSSV